MQKVFDVDNKEDMDLLWSILPDKYKTIIRCSDYMLDRDSFHCMTEDNGVDVYESFGIFFKINWHDKTEITRPVNYEDMIGCVGYFKDEYVNGCLGVLKDYHEFSDYPYETMSNTSYKYFTPAKKSELKFYEDK